MQKNSRRWSTDVEWTEEAWDLSPVKELVIWWVTRGFFFWYLFLSYPSKHMGLYLDGDGRKKPPDLSVWWSQRRCDGCSSSESLAQMFAEHDNDCNASPRLESELCLGAQSQIRMQPGVRMQLPIGLRDLSSSWKPSEGRESDANNNMRDKDDGSNGLPVTGYPSCQLLGRIRANSWS